MSFKTDEQIAIIKSAKLIISIFIIIRLIEGSEAQVLSERRDYLCQYINPKAHYPYLRSRYILSEDDEEVIEAQIVRKQKVHKFIDLLARKGERAFDEFLKSIIQERTQVFVAEELKKLLDEKRRRLNNLLSQDEKSNTDCGYVQVTTVSNGSQSSNQHITLCSKSESSGHFSLSSSRTSTISDLGVDTDKLPKPVMPKRAEKTVDDEVIRYSGDISYLREKSIEENEDKSARKSSISSSNA